MTDTFDKTCVGHSEHQRLFISNINISSVLVAYNKCLRFLENIKQLKLNKWLHSINWSIYRMLLQRMEVLQQCLLKHPDIEVLFIKLNTYWTRVGGGCKFHGRFLVSNQGQCTGPSGYFLRRPNYQTNST